MDTITYLGPAEAATNRPFAHPEHIAGDLNALRYLVDQLCLFLESPHLYADLPRPIIFHRPEPPKEWTYRMVVVQREMLMRREELTFVGFLGQRREDADREAAAEFDRMLLGELPEHPGLLSYSTMGLISGNFSNLVLFADEEAKAHWSLSKAHAQAANRLSPDFYTSVRLYNGTLPIGIAASNHLKLARIKYFDYSSQPLWRAVRVFEEEV